MLQINNLSKTYSNGVKALKHVSLEINNGMFGLLGPNGAGKSSLMRTIAGLQDADHGSITLYGEDILTNPKKVKEQLGYLPQSFGVYPKISAKDLLQHIAILKGISNKKDRNDQVDYLLNKVNLYDKRKEKVSKFSGGMKQRVGIAQALLGDPSIVIVDEPTAGLDPAERNRFYNLLADVGSDKVVILSTHIVEDVSQLCTALAIVNQGSVVYTGSPTKCIELLQHKVFRKIIDRSEWEAYNQQYDILSNKLIAGRLEIRVCSDTQPEGFDCIEPNLEDVFFNETKILSRV